MIHYSVISASEDQKCHSRILKFFKNALEDEVIAHGMKIQESTFLCVSFHRECARDLPFWFMKSQDPIQPLHILVKWVMIFRRIDNTTNKHLPDNTIYTENLRTFFHTFLVLLRIVVSFSDEFRPDLCSLVRFEYRQSTYIQYHVRCHCQ